MCAAVEPALRAEAPELSAKRFVVIVTDAVHQTHWHSTPANSTIAFGASAQPPGTFDAASH